MIRSFFCGLVMVFLTSQNGFSQPTFGADVIANGGTLEGMMRSVEAQKLVKSAILVPPDVTLGGHSSDGLGFTEIGNKPVIDGLEFYHRDYFHYQQDSAGKWQKKEDDGNKGQGTPAMNRESRTIWIFEAHVAEKGWLNMKSSVEMDDDDKTIKSFTAISGKKYLNKIFIDASYGGNLVASAGKSYHVGRKSNETWNDAQLEVFQHNHYFKNISPLLNPNDPTSGLLPVASILTFESKGCRWKRIKMIIGV